WFLARSPAVLFAGNSKSAAALAERLFESPYRELSQPDGEPLLIIGLHEAVDGVLKQLTLPPRPSMLAGKGTAQVWTVQASVTPVAVISAKDEPALEALARPL